MITTLFEEEIPLHDRLQNFRQRPGQLCEEILWPRPNTFKEIFAIRGGEQLALSLC
jgi:hypothetical protein